jgi:hypothetical protein
MQKIFAKSVGCSARVIVIDDADSAQKNSNAAQPKCHEAISPHSENLLNK